MIFGRMEDLHRYDLCKDPLFERVALFCKQAPSIPYGSHWIQEPFLRVIRERSRGKGYKEVLLEGHRWHTDLHIVLEGHDRIGVHSRSKCGASREYEEDRDIEFFEEKALSWIDLYPGYFCLFSPEDLHAPLSFEGGVEKLIFKLLQKEVCPKGDSNQQVGGRSKF